MNPRFLPCSAYYHVSSVSLHATRGLPADATNQRKDRRELIQKSLFCGVAYLQTGQTAGQWIYKWPFSSISLSSFNPRSPPSVPLLLLFAQVPQPPPPVPLLLCAQVPPNRRRWFLFLSPPKCPNRAALLLFFSLVPNCSYCSSHG